MSEAERQDIAAKRWTCKHWHSEPCGYCALEAENEALRKDAARYMRKRRIDYEKMVRQVGEDDAYFSEHVFNLSYDAAIDAALAARSKT